MPTSLPLTRPVASASGRSGHELATQSSGGTVRSTVGQPQEHLPVTCAWSSWGRNTTASGGANSRRRRSARALSSADKALSSSSVLAGLSLGKRSSRLINVSNLHCARSRAQAFTEFRLYRLLLFPLPEFRLGNHRRLSANRVVYGSAVIRPERRWPRRTNLTEASFRIPYMWLTLSWLTREVR
jgi:hypothetical protein